MTDPAAAIARTPRHPGLLPFMAGSAFAVAAMTALWNLPDEGWDTAVRFINRLHSRD